MGLTTHVVGISTERPSNRTAASHTSMPLRRPQLAISVPALGAPRRLSAMTIDSDGCGGIATPASSGGKIIDSAGRSHRRQTRRQSPYGGAKVVPPQQSVGLSGPMAAMGFKGVGVRKTISLAPLQPQPPSHPPPGSMLGSARGRSSSVKRMPGFEKRDMCNLQESSRTNKSR